MKNTNGSTRFCHNSFAGSLAQMSRRLTLTAFSMFVVSATIFAAIAQGQYTPSLMPPKTAHPSADRASINVKSDSLTPATSTCSYSFTIPGKANSYLSFCVTVNGNIVSLAWLR